MASKTVTRSITGRIWAPVFFLVSKVKASSQERDWKLAMNGVHGTIMYFAFSSTNFAVKTNLTNREILTKEFSVCLRFLILIIVWNFVVKN